MLLNDARGGAFDAFTYPKLASLNNSRPFLAVVANVLRHSPQINGIVAGAVDSSGDDERPAASAKAIGACDCSCRTLSCSKGHQDCIACGCCNNDTLASLRWVVQSGPNGTHAPIGSGMFSAIADYAVGDNGWIAFQGLSRAPTKCRDPTSTSTAGGYLSPLGRKRGRRVAMSPPAPAPPEEGIFSAQVTNSGATVLRTILTTKDRLSPLGVPAGALGWPSIDHVGNVAALACDEANNDVSGVYFRAVEPGSPLRRIADTSMPARAPGGPRFHLFFSVTISGQRAVFTANTKCHASERYEAGVVVATDSEAGNWSTTTIAGLCGGGNATSSGQPFVGFGDAVLSPQGLVGFVAQTADGKEGIYRYQMGLENTTVAPVVRAGAPAPSSAGGVFAQFPETPSVHHGEFVFLAHLSTGETGIYRADPEGRISKLVDTNDTLEHNRTVVYLGLGGNALTVQGDQGAYTFYASTVDAAGREPYDAIYAGWYSRHAR